MSSLADFDCVLQALRSEKKKNVDLLHMFVYENDGDRHNRKRLRGFDGFDFLEADELFNQKVSYVAQNLSNSDLAIICNILGLRHDKSDLMLHIFRNLRAGKLLEDTDEEDSEDDEVDEREENDEDNDEKSSNGDDDELELHTDASIDGFGAVLL